MHFKVIDGGFLTSIQDIGRYGYQKYGVSPSGVMDSYSARVANKLVSNDEDTSLLETTFKGVTLEFYKECTVAITGGECKVHLGEDEIKLWRSYRVKAGDILKMEYCTSGIRNYIAFHGGIDVPVIMGSRSTNLRAKLGGVEGRKVIAGDKLSLLVGKDKIENKVLKNSYIPKFTREIEVGIVLGQQMDSFSKEERDKLFDNFYEISGESDRMGIRLKGEKISHLEKADILSDGITLGSIQIPGDGQPIIMMADRQTTGGYTKIGNIITAHLPRLGQGIAGSKIKFIEIEYSKAVEELRKEKMFFNNIEENLEKLNPPKRYAIRVNGKLFNVEVEEIIEVMEA